MTMQHAMQHAMQQVTLKRLYKKESYTIGKLYVNDQYLCDSLEDTDRNLTQDMSLEEIKSIKVYGETAIPTGVYECEITYSSKFKRDLPLINNVKGFDGIRIHSGNSAKDSLGCILCGENKIKGGLINSKQTLERLMKVLDKEFVLTITD